MELTSWESEAKISSRETGPMQMSKRCGILDGMRATEGEKCWVGDKK